MIYARDAFGTLPLMPPWVTAKRGKTPEDVAFLSGAALSHLHVVLGHDAITQVLLRERLALSLAVNCRNALVLFGLDI